MNSYDIDGVLTKGIKPEEPCIIVSGRLNKFTEETKRQMKELKINPLIRIFLRPFGEPADRIAAGYWKSAIISMFNIEKHYEDDPVQIDIIKKNCPNVNVIIVT